MADKIIITTDGGSKTIENINPAARNATLAQFGEKIADLTTNTYQKTDRITKVNVDTEPGGGAKPTPTLTITPIITTIANVPGAPSTDIFCKVQTNSDGQITAKSTNTNYQQALFLQVPPTTANSEGNVFAIKPTGAVAQTIRFYVQETDNFSGTYQDYTLT